MNKRIENVTLEPTWTSYIAALGGVLKSCGYYKDNIDSLMGDTGMAWHFIVHNKTCASSVTVYDWCNTHRDMHNRIGIESKIVCVMDFAGNIDSDNIQKQSIKEIKESIDRGFCVLTWAPSPILEFGIITGYDDEDEIFYISNVTGSETDPLLFKNLGLSNVPILYYEILIGKKDIKTNLKSSLDFAAKQWKSEYHVSADYKTGNLGYKTLTNSLNKRTYDLNGLSYIIAVYQNSKKSIVKFLEERITSAEGSKVVENYQKVEAKFSEVKDIIPFPFTGELSEKKSKRIAELMEDCRILEEESINLFEQL